MSVVIVEEVARKLARTLRFGSEAALMHRFGDAGLFAGLDRP